MDRRWNNLGVPLGDGCIMKALELKKLILASFPEVPSVRVTDVNYADGISYAKEAKDTMYSFMAGTWAGRNATGTARGYIDCYAADPGSGHNPTNDLIFFDNGNLYLGRGTNTANKIVLRNLPTSDPGEAGQLWQSGSNLYISTGP